MTIEAVIIEKSAGRLKPREKRKISPKRIAKKRIG